MSNAGTYIVKCGSTAYIGSSSNLVQRKSAHKRDLERGIHQNPNLQAAFNKCRQFSFIPHQFIAKVDCQNELRTILRNAEQSLLDECIASNLWDIANVSKNAFGPDQRPDLVERWKDPEFREKMTNLRRGRVTTDDTKRKMSLAKQGAKNYNSKQVVVTNPDGSETTYDTTTDAAKFFGISQQLMHLMLVGKSSWPGTGKFIRNKANAWMAGYRARFA